MCTPPPPRWFSLVTGAGPEPTAVSNRHTNAVGGKILDMAFGQAAEHARFIECGLISQYNTSNPVGPRNFSRVVTMRIRVQGFIVFDHMADYPQARKELAAWLAEGKLKKAEHILKGGLEVAEQGLVDLYKGVNTGKLIVEVKPEQPRL